MHYVAIAMPVYNEADGLKETLSDLSTIPELLNIQICLFIQDDCSNDGSVELFHEVQGSVFQIDAESNKRRLGHGPTVHRAYQRALESNPDCIVQLDGDGQFKVDDVIKIIVSLISGSEMAIGVRNNRTAPKHRRFASSLLRLIGLLVFNVNSKDLNSPIRGFRAESLSRIFTLIHQTSLIPNVYLSILGSRYFKRIEQFDVEDRTRRGSYTVGSAWRKRKGLPLPNFKFLIFSIRALIEIFSIIRKWKKSKRSKLS
jgi:dolichol-phosphate mannosyltransferase